MPAKAKVGILSTLSAPLLPHTIAQFVDHGVDNLCVILDSKVRSEKDRIIWQERTAGRLDDASLDIYSFGAGQVPFYFMRNHNDTACIALVRALSIDLLVNAGTPRKLSPDLIAAPSIGVVNVHPGVLPKYRGATCVEWAIFNDDLVGNTAHFMTEGYDEGPIIDSESYRYPKGVTYQDIRVDIYEKAIGLMVRSVKRVAEQRLLPSQLPAQGDGILHKPIDDEAMKFVISRLADATYSGLY